MYDDYDLGSKNQCSSIGTRFGTRRELQRCVAILRANGLEVYVDMVPHQRDGGNNGEYRYVGSDRKTLNGRFSKHPGCFVGTPPRVPRDPIAGPVSDDFSFGDEFAPINSVPKGYVMQGLIDAGDWLTRTLDIQGYRVDDVKGMAVEFVRTWLGSKSMASRFAVSEYDDGNPQNLNWWAWQSGMGGRSAVFDFALHYTLEAMCNNASNWNMAQLDHAGLAGISPMQAVTFVENPDTDTDGFGSVKFNKILAYAYILTSEGYPCVYYRDYSTDADCYGLKPHIDTLIWIHENLAFGSTVERWKDFQCFAYERLGAPNLLVALNNNGSGGWRTITVQTAFGANVQLHDYSGHAGDVWTDANGMVTIGVPQNDDGLGYVCYSRTGYGAAFTVNGLAVTQEFFGADDLDIGPLVDSASIDVGPCWCAEGTPIAATLAPPATGVSATTSVDVALVGPDGAIVATGRWLESAQQALTVHAVAKNEGWYTARLSAVNLADLSIPFSLTMQYCAPRKL